MDTKEQLKLALEGTGYYTDLLSDTFEDSQLSVAASDANYWIGESSSDFSDEDFPKITALTLLLKGGAQPNLIAPFPGLRFPSPPMEKEKHACAVVAPGARHYVSEAFVFGKGSKKIAAWWVLVLVDDLELAAATLLEAGKDIFPGLEHFVLQPPCTVPPGEN